MLDPSEAKQGAAQVSDLLIVGAWQCQWPHILCWCWCTCEKPEHVQAL